mgnify:CR=1 FL=1
MRSLSNKTNYDDELFYNTITSSLKTVFICPVEGPYKIKNKNNNQKLLIQAEKTIPVKAAADGTVIQVQTSEQETTIILEHKNKIVTKYTPLKSSPIKPKTKVSQGDILGYAKEFTFTIRIDSSILFPLEEKKNGK